MRIVQGTENLLQMEKTFPPEQYFTPGCCPYHYCIYEKGEFLQTPDSSGHKLHIVLSGSVQIYSISASGQKAPIAVVESGCPVGELEVCGKYVPFYAESARRTECLVLSISDCREFLFDDPIFLRFLVHTLAEKLTFSSNIDYSAQDMNERVLFYLRTQPDHRIHHVEEVTYSLRCSRSSLQRSLVQLCRDGRIEKIGKGSYHLKDSPCPDLTR